MNQKIYRSIQKQDGSELISIFEKCEKEVIYNQYTRSPTGKTNSNIRRVKSWNWISESNSPTINCL